MALDAYQQIQQAIEGKKNILITFKKDGRGDAIGSAVALLLFLEKIGKRAEIIVDEFDLPNQFHFLKKANDIKPQFSHLHQFIVTIDVGKDGVQELSYDIKEEKLRIFVTPKGHSLTRDHVRTAQSEFKYDLIIVLDTQDLESLGDLYHNNTDLFFKTPLITLDHDSGNEHFGQINLVELTATSTAEVVYDLLKKLGEEYIDTDIATALLTGMIASTHSFRGDNVKPTTLAAAGKLVAAGANRDFIVQNLYRTRTLSTLKLWGQALAHLESEPSIGLVSTAITRDDFVRAGASENELQDIIDELISNSPEAKIILVLHEHTTPDHTQQIHCILNGNHTHDALSLLQPFKAHGNKKQASCIIEGKTLTEAETMIAAHIKTTLQAQT